MEELKLKNKKWVIKLVVLLLVVYLPFIATRYSRHTTYIPFSGQVFRLNSEELEGIRFQSGNTGRYIEYREEDGIREITDYLNSFRYRVWIPAPPRGAGWSYRVVFYFTDGESVSYLFNSSSICVKGVWHWGKLDYFNQFTEALDDLPPDDTPAATIPVSSSDIPN